MKFSYLIRIWHCKMLSFTLWARAGDFMRKDGLDWFHHDFCATYSRLMGQVETFFSHDISYWTLFFWADKYLQLTPLWRLKKTTYCDYSPSSNWFGHHQIFRRLPRTKEAIYETRRHHSTSVKNALSKHFDQMGGWTCIMNVVHATFVELTESIKMIKMTISQM